MEKAKDLAMLLQALAEFRGHSVMTEAVDKAIAAVLAEIPIAVKGH